MARCWTEKQTAAIEERGKTLLISAAAGAGKTATLTERVIRTLLDERHPGDISRMLIVTFTRAAAAELRERISAALSEEIAKSPHNRRLTGQLLCLGQAKICTIDSFCNDLVRSHAGELSLDAGYRIMDGAESDVLSATVLEELIEECYAGEASLGDGDCAPPLDSAAFCGLAETLVDAKSTEDLAAVLLELYERTLGLEEGCRVFANAARRLREEAQLPALEGTLGRIVLEHTRGLAAHFHGELSRLAENPGWCLDDEKRYRDAITSDVAFFGALMRAEPRYETIAALLGGHTFLRVGVVRGHSPGDTYVSERYPALRKEAKDAVGKLAEYYAEDEALYKRNLLASAELNAMLYAFFAEFSRRLEAEKRRRGALSFNDLEHYALQLLYKEGKPTRCAEELRAAYDAVYIDEYQDVNSVQHRIFEAVSTPTNRFMVGDIKQSIYSFRHAEPGIFAGLQDSFPVYGTKEAENSPTAALSMTENFRCDPAVVWFVNYLFDGLFGAAGETIGYTGKEDCFIGAKQDVGVGCVPVRLVALRSDGRDSEDEEEDEEDSLDSDAEGIPEDVLQVAKYVKKILDDECVCNDLRLLRPSDIAILLRNTSSRAALYARALKEYGVPAVTEVKGEDFLRSPEVHLALSLLHVIDNPRRDIRLAAVLRSPLYGIDAEELISIRRVDKNATLYDCLCRYTAEGNADEPAVLKGKRFLAEQEELRRMAQGMSADKLVKLVYAKTGLPGMVDTAEGKSNLMLLYRHAEKFEQTSFHGLYHFLAYIREVVAADKMLDSSVGAEEAEGVRIMSIHASKGLEFPVVILGDAHKRFSDRDLRRNLLFDSELGAFSRTVHATGLLRVDSVARRTAILVRREREIEEEMRVLYVACTRAKERLYITAAVSEKKLPRLLRNYRGNGKTEQTMGVRNNRIDRYAVMACRSYLDMLLLATEEGACALDTATFFEKETKELSEEQAQINKNHSYLVAYYGGESESEAAAAPNAEKASGILADLPFHPRHRAQFFNRLEGDSLVECFERMARQEVDKRLSALPPESRKLSEDELREQIYGDVTAAHALVLSNQQEDIEKSPLACVLAQMEVQGELVGEKTKEIGYSILDAVKESEERDAAEATASSQETVDLLARRFAFRYEYDYLRKVPEKLSVSHLTPALLDGTEETVAELSVPVTGKRESAPIRPRFLTGEQEGTGAADAAARGIATHQLLQFCDFALLKEKGAAAELARLTAGGFLRPEEGELVRIEEVEAFRRSELIGLLLTAKRLRRELRFNSLLSAARFTDDPTLAERVKEERLLVQGVIDCIAEQRDGSYVLIDYKTDRLTAAELADPALARARMQRDHGVQLAYYAEACLGMYGRYPARTLVYSLHSALAYEMTDTVSRE